MRLTARSASKAQLENTVSNIRSILLDLVDSEDILNQQAKIAIDTLFGRIAAIEEHLGLPSPELRLEWNHSLLEHSSGSCTCEKCQTEVEDELTVA